MLRTADAETPSPLPEWQYAAGVALRPYDPEGIPRWDVSVGGSSEVMPRYEGAARDHLLAAPLIDVRYEDLAFLSTSEGAGINLLRGKDGRAGLAITYDFGRPHGASADTHNVGDIRASPEGKVFAEYVLFPAVIRADVRRGFGARGWAGDLGVYAPVAGTTSVVVLAGGSLAFADRDFMQRHFGITPEQSAASGYATRDAHGGLKSVNLGANAAWYIDEHWFIDGDGAVERLCGDAASSPLTRRKLQLGAVLSAGFDF